MLETGSPPLAEGDEAAHPPRHSVSPRSMTTLAHHEHGHERRPSVSSRSSSSSSLDASAFDGTPRYLSAALLAWNLDRRPPSDPLTSRSVLLPLPSSQGMALNLGRSASDHRHGFWTSADPVRTSVRRPPEVVLPDYGHQGASQIRDHSPLPSLTELSNSLRQEKSQARRCRAAEHQLHQAQLAAAKTARLIRTARSVQRTLAECIKVEDKQSFGILFNAFVDTVSGPLEVVPQSRKGPIAGHAHDSWYPASLVDALPSRLRAPLLEVIDRVRCDAQFVADRLTALSHQDLLALLPERGHTKSMDSIFGTSARAASRTSRHLGYIVYGQMDMLSTFEFSSPLETLVCSVHGCSGDTSPRGRTATDVWATVCARLITEQKPGSEKVVPAVIDLWAPYLSPAGRHTLDLWISQTLQDGSFLLEHSTRQGFRIQGRLEVSPTDTVRLETFYSSAVNSLLDLLADTSGASIIPVTLVEFCQSIHEKLHRSPGHQRAFPDFVVTRWLFPFLVLDAVMLPEIHGVAVDRYISDFARQRILREVVIRCQKAVFDVVYQWKIGTTPAVDLVRRVQSLKALFEPGPHSSDGRRATLGSDNVQLPSVTALSRIDILTLVNAIYPPRRSASLSSDHEHSRTDLQSSASSLSGFSLFSPFSDGESSDATDPVPTPGATGPGRTELSCSVATRTDDVHFEALPLQETLLIEQLHEACARLEALNVDKSSSGSDHWCFLYRPSSLGPWCTVRKELQRSREATNPELEPCHQVEEELVQATQDEASRHAFHDVLLAQRTEDLPSLTNGFVSRSKYLEEVHTWFTQACQQQIRGCEENAQFVAACSVSVKLQVISRNVAQHGLESLADVINHLYKVNKRSLSQSAARIAFCDAGLRNLESRTDELTESLRACADMVYALRDKMWYTADVRTSAPFDDLRSIASALRIMGKPKKPQGARQTPPLRHWSGNKLSTNLHLKTEAQVLEFLSASPGHGGPNKLSDDQARGLATWMERHAVENICRGEERLQKLCMEIRKVVEQVTSENSTLWHSVLFSRDKVHLLQPSPHSPDNSSLAIQQGIADFDKFKLRSDNVASIDVLTSAPSQPLSAQSSRDRLETRSPTLTSKSSVAFWSPATTDIASPSSATSVVSSQTRAAILGPYGATQALELDASLDALVHRVRANATSLLLSDVAVSLFDAGSETDAAFWTGLGGKLTSKHFTTLMPAFAVGSAPAGTAQQYNFQKAFEGMFRCFVATCNPFSKLKILHSVDTLLDSYHVRSHQIPPGTWAQARWSATAACGPQDTHTGDLLTADAKVAGFATLFCSSSIRPGAIFRDLQCIAALVPSTELETSQYGRAFWNAVVAISGLKQEARSIMIETADNIIAYQSNNRGHGRISSSAQRQRDAATFPSPLRAPSTEDVSQLRMEDAAHLLQIAAKEGDVVAQRELATLYLTHPEHVERIIAPLARPRDVFKEELESKWRKNQDPHRCDPITMCVAHHWMSLSAQGGDALAKEYLRQREEMERLP